MTQQLERSTNHAYWWTPIKYYHFGSEWAWEQWQWRCIPHSLKLRHYWGLTIRFVSIIYRTLIYQRGSLTTLQRWRLQPQPTRLLDLVSILGEGKLRIQTSCSQQKKNDLMSNPEFSKGWGKFILIILFIELKRLFLFMIFPPQNFRCLLSINPFYLPLSCHCQQPIEKIHTKKFPLVICYVNLWFFMLILFCVLCLLSCSFWSFILCLLLCLVFIKSYLMMFTSILGMPLGWNERILYATSFRHLICQCISLFLIISWVWHRCDLEKYEDTKSIDLVKKCIKMVKIYRMVKKYIKSFKEWLKSLQNWLLVTSDFTTFPIIFFIKFLTSTNLPPMK